MAAPWQGAIPAAILSASADGILGADLNGQILFCSKSALRMLGYERDEDLVGNALRAVTRTGEAGDEAPAGEDFHKCFVAEKAGRAGQTKFRRRDGSDLPVEYQCRPIFEDKKPVGGVVCFTDTSETAAAISARHEAENAAREHEARFRAVVENAAAAIVLKSLDGEFLLTNRVQELWYGMASDEARGKTAYDLFPSDIADELTSQDTRVKETGQAANFEIELPFADGTLHTLLVTKFPVRLADGTLLAIGSFSTDITELKLADAAVRRSEQRLRAAVDSLHEGFALFDDQDRAVIVNEAYCQLNPAAAEAVQKGWTFEDLLRINVSRGVLSDALGREEEFIRDRLAHHHAGDTSTVRQYAGERYLLIKESRIADGGTALAFVDISDQKRIEQALRESEAHLLAVVDNSSSAISLRDEQGRFLLLNSEFRRQYGIGQQDAKGRRPSEVLSADLTERVCLNDDEVRETAQAVSFENQSRDSEGNLRTELINKFPIRDEQANVVGIGSISTDITEYKDLEERLYHGQKLEAIGQLTGGVAHDFNNILAVILTDLEFLQERVGGNSVNHDIVSEAIRAVHRGANLTGRLLAFSRKQQLRPEALDLVAVISEMVDLLRRTLGEVITVQTEFAGDLRHVFVDRSQFENAVLNLAVNARDAMRGGGKLVIVVTNREVLRRRQGRINEIPPGKYVCVEVRDTGEGMTEEVLARAFEPFFTTKERGQGSGLGLSMVYGFVAQSGGTVSVASRLGEGSSVKMMFPAVAEDHADIKAAGGERAGRKDEPAGGSETILVVEDDADVAASARRTLESLGYNVLEAGDARAALTILRQEGKKIDLIFSDLVMPGGMNGHELAEVARQISPRIKICLTSGYSDATTSPEQTEGEGITFLAKPYRRRPLAETVRRLLDGPNPK